MTKQVTLVDHERMIHNITSVYRDADETQHAEGLLWYSDAQKAAYHIAVKYDVPVYIVVAVIAALSPNNKWSRNVANAATLIAAYIRGDGIHSVKVSTYLQDEAKGLGHLGGASGLRRRKNDAQGPENHVVFLRHHGGI